MKLLAILSVLFLSISPSFSYAEERIGIVAKTQGNGFIKRAEKELPFTINTPVQMGDTIETLKNSRILIQFKDNTEITLGEDAYLTIDEYVYEPENNQKSSFLASIVKGAFLLTGGKIEDAEEANTRVKFPHGSIGIRGTTFWGGEMDQAYKVFVADGEVSVSTEAGSVLLKKGEGTATKDKSTAPTQAKKWPEDKVTAAVATITFAE